jgi:Ser/Thr protein kinase RdoA (MazF antagonist)
MNPEILKLGLKEAYGVDFDDSQIGLFGTGHIHQTYLISGNSGQFILQKFNKLVFRHPDRISHNHHLLSSRLDPANLTFILPLPIPNQSGQLFTTIDGYLYRISPFVSGRCLDSIENAQQAFLAAFAFGKLIRAAAHIPSELFEESIPGFHNLGWRFEQFMSAIETTSLILKGELRELVDFYMGQQDLVSEYESWTRILPLRLTHNDTKINNLIFSEDLSEVKAVIDLDTLMGGYAYFDFGDLVRTVACTKDESSTDWNLITVDEEKYNALYNGFLAALDGLLSDAEIKSLSFGGPMMTCIMGLRFLTDYLNGNLYYTTNYAEQNFHRSKNQMILLKALLEKRSV